MRDLQFLQFAPMISAFMSPCFPFSHDYNSVLCWFVPQNLEAGRILLIMELECNGVLFMVIMFTGMYESIELLLH